MIYIPFYSHNDRDDSENMKVGDRVRIKISALPRPASHGTIKELSEHGVTVEFDHGLIVEYDSDDLTLAK